ncbi:MAG TPA: DUF883 domain-containing protein [Gammaproteobacteria bacterium]|nr:DUF883 domain-containing protein [Gammaproteobacteria bacterium]
MNAANDMNVAKERLVKDFRAVATDAEELLKATASQTGERVTAARARIEETLREARERLAELEEGALARGKQAVRRTDEYVHDHPWESIGVAGAVGLLLGMLISRR